MKNNRKKIIVVLVILSIVNLIFLFVFPDRFEARRTENDKMVSQGNGKAELHVANKELNFNGKGLFNAMEDVYALDNDGQDMTDRIAITYTSKDSIENKEIHYIVYDSKSEKLEDVASLHLKDYTGPKIQLEAIDSVTWDQLQRLDEILVEKGNLKATDGFGNDASEAVSFMFKLLPETKSAEVTFSLINQFQDIWTEKMVVQVEDFPEDY